MKRRGVWQAIVAAAAAIATSARGRAQEPIIITPAGPPVFGPPTQWPNGLCGACKQWAALPIAATGPEERIVECGWCHTLYVQRKEVR